MLLRFQPFLLATLALRWRPRGQNPKPQVQGSAQNLMIFDLVQLALLLACVIALCAGLRNDAAEMAAMRAVAPRPLEESRAQLRDVEAAEAPRRVANDERSDDEPPTYAEIVGPLRAP